MEAKLFCALGVAYHETPSGYYIHACTLTFVVFFPIVAPRSRRHLSICRRLQMYLIADVLRLGLLTVISEKSSFSKNPYI